MQPTNSSDTVMAQLTAPGAPFELVQAEVDDQTVLVFRNADANLPALLNRGRQHGDKTFLVYDGEQYSFTRFFNEADGLAAWMHTQGVRAGDRVAIAMRNRPQWAVAFVAAGLLGAVSAPINSFGKRDELRRAIRAVAPKLVCVDSERLRRLEGDAGSPEVEAVVRVGPETPDSISLAVHAYEQAIDTDAGALPAVRPAPDDPALILFTSGATSRPKGVLSTHRAVCQAITNIDFVGAYSALASPELVAKLMQAGNEPATLTVVPLFHVSGLHAQLLSALKNGRKLVFIHRWDPTEALRLMRTEKITQFNGAPAMVRQIMDEDGFADAEVKDRLMAVGFGGAGIPGSLTERVFSELPERMVGTGFGMTESNGVGSAVSGDLFQAHPASSGMVSPLMEVRIADEQGASLPVGEAGEIWFRGVSVMKEYWNDTEATQRALTDGWLHTGDLGCLDEDGFLYIVDRLKDMINRSGENIAALEVEQCLMAHPAISEAAVFGVPDECTDEAVIAVVRATGASRPSAAELREHVRARLASYKVPRDIEVRQAPLARNAAGKLVKLDIKKEFLKGRVTG